MSTKPTTKRTNTTKQKPQVKNVVEEKVEVVKQEIIKPEKRKLNRDDSILVMNNTAGTLIYKSNRSGQEWYFTEYGQTDTIELGELITMNNAHGKFLKEPWLIVLDDDAVEYLGLKRFYDNIFEFDNIDSFFEMPETKMEELLNKMPNGMKELIVGLSRRKIAEGTFDSMSKIRLIEQKLKVNLSED